MVCGCFTTDSQQLKELLGENFNLGICKLVLEECAIQKVDEEVVGSPEDFLEHMDSHDWMNVARNGKRLKGKKK